MILKKDKKGKGRERWARMKIGKMLLCCLPVIHFFEVKEVHGVPFHGHGVDAVFRQIVIASRDRLKEENMGMRILSLYSGKYSNTSL